MKTESKTGRQGWLVWADQTRENSAVTVFPTAQSMHAIRRSILKKLLARMRKESWWY